MPTTKDSTMKAMPMTASFQPEKLNFFWMKPNTTANTMNMMETMPAAPLVKAASTCAPSSVEGVEGAGDHVCEGSNDDAAEQPAEQQEQLAAGLADVLLDQQAHGFTVVLDGSVQSAEVSDSAEKDAADQYPEQNRQPAEGSSLNSTGDRAGTCDRRELVCKHSPAVGGNVVFAILQPHSGSFGVGVDTPGLGEPATVSCVRTYQDDRGNQNDYKRIHLNRSLFPTRFYNRLCTLLYCAVRNLST